MSALPCSSFFAFISNIFEVKGDAWKLMNLYQRPVPVIAQDIGAFQQIFTVIAGCSVISNAALMKFTLTVLNDFDQFTQWWIFVGFQWVMFTVMVVLASSIEEESQDTRIQRQRGEYLGSKLIEHMADDDVDIVRPSTEPEILKPYPFFGSQVRFSQGQGYLSETESRATSRATSRAGSFAANSGGHIDSATATLQNLPESVLECNDEDTQSPLTEVLLTKGAKSQ